MLTPHLQSTPTKSQIQYFIDITTPSLLSKLEDSIVHKSLTLTESLDQSYNDISVLQARLAREKLARYKAVEGMNKRMIDKVNGVANEMLRCLDQRLAVVDNDAKKMNSINNGIKKTDAQELKNEQSVVKRIQQLQNNMNQTSIKHFEYIHHNLPDIMREYLNAEFILELHDAMEDENTKSNRREEFTKQQISKIFYKLNLLVSQMESSGGRMGSNSNDIVLCDPYSLEKHLEECVKDLRNIENHLKSVTNSRIKEDDRVMDRVVDTHEELQRQILQNVAGSKS